MNLSIDLYTRFCYIIEEVKTRGLTGMSREVQSEYSRVIKTKQRLKAKQEVIEQVGKLPSGKIASRALRERGRTND